MDRTEEQIAQLDAETDRLNAQTRLLIAKTERSSQRRLKVGHFLHSHAWLITLASLAAPALAFAVGFDRWFAFYPLLISTATLSLLLALTDVMERGFLTSTARRNLIAGLLVATLGVVLSATN